MMAPGGKGRVRGDSIVAGGGSERRYGHLDR
jgi:hypothetical protein